MNILFLYISLPHLSQSGVFNDLIREFDKQGHNVKVALPLRGDSEAGERSEAGIDVLRFKTGQLTNNKSNIIKGLNFMRLAYQFPRAINKHFGREHFDLIIAHSLPSEMGIIAPILKKRFKAPFYLMLNEYIWQDSVSLGYFSEKSLICRYYQWLEKKLIKAADFIGCPSQGNIDFALRYYPWAMDKNMHVLHYSQAPVVAERNETIRKKHNLEHKFVAIYGGNMSVAQKIENVIDVAEACLDYPDILFLLIGRGQDERDAKAEVAKRQISNVRFLEFMPQEEYLQLLASCDVGLVSLNEKLVLPNIPSKTLSYFSLSIPVVASIDRSTDYGQYLEMAGAGLWSYAGDVEKFKENIVNLYQNPGRRKEMGENGYRFYQNHMLPVKGYESMLSEFRKNSVKLILNTIIKNEKNV